MKKLLSLFIFALLLALAVSAETLTTTKLRNTCADPWLFTHNDFFYLARTGATRIAVHKTETLAELISSKTEDSIAYDAAKDPTVEVLYGTQYPVNGTWSPEIHYFSEEDFGKEYAGWYMFVGLRRQKETGSAYESEYLRLVVLKSLTDDPAGPYGHPTKGIENYSQPVILANGKTYEEWACGQSILRIPEGEYAGIYTLWVDEVGRGTSNFYQRIRISKLENPWTLTGKEGIVTVPTQDWEFRGSEDGFHPAVVEGGTAVYGKNGDIYIIYSGSGYQSDYGLGQLTWNGGDPLETSSWVKYANNPIFSSKTAANLIGAGHASFLTDESGDGFFCYHAYPAKNGVRDGDRNAYLERYTIDYSANNGIGYGLVRLGEGKPASSSTEVTFDTDGTKLSVPTPEVLYTSGMCGITAQHGNEDGIIIYRSENGGAFTYLATTDANDVFDDVILYVDESIAVNTTYTYRTYPYRGEEIGTEYAEVSITTEVVLPPLLSAEATEDGVLLTAYATDDYESIIFFRESGEIIESIGSEYNVSVGDAVTFLDTEAEGGTAYSYFAMAYRGDLCSEFSDYAYATVPVKVVRPTLNAYPADKRLFVGCTNIENFDSVTFYRSEDGDTFTEWHTFDELADGGFSIYSADSSVRYGRTYYYYAIGMAGDKESAPSEVFSYTVDFLPTPQFYMGNNTCKSVALYWNGGEDGTCYITRSEDGGVTFTELATVTGTQTYTDTTVQVGKEYIYAIRCVSEELGMESDTDEFVPIDIVHRKDSITKPGMSASCTEDGYTEYRTCRWCDTVMQGKDPIPATGHNHVLIAEEIPATYESEGKTAVYECTVCGDTYGGDVIPKLYEAGSGDANGDGKISLTDAIRILRMIRADEFSTEADLSADGEITVLDALMLLQKIVNGEV